MSDKLAVLNNIESRIAAIETLDEAKGIRDQAEALRAYAKSAGVGLIIQNRAAKVKILAERRAGKIIKETPRNTPNGKKSEAGLLSMLESNKIPVVTAYRWEALTEIPEAKIEEIAAQKTEASEELTSCEMFQMVRRAKAKRKQDKRTAANAIDQSGYFTDLGKVSGSFGCIYIDPPWKYGNQATRGSSEDHYPTMPIGEISELPIKSLASPKSHLHLWTTNGFLFEAKALMDGWGFEFKSSFVWVKPQMGMGNYWRCSHEFLLLGVRGGQRGQVKNLKSWGEFKRGKHSQKPEEIRKLIEKISPGPYLEMFGRRAVAGWTVFGNQILGG